MNRYKKNSLLLQVAASAALSIFGITIADGQGQGSGSQTPKAQQVQLSGRSQGGATVSVQQSSSGSTSSSVNTLNPTVTVQDNYAGSVDSPLTGSGPLDLNFAQAIDLGLRYNLGGVASDASSRQLRGQRLSALSALLPNIYATLSETVQRPTYRPRGSPLPPSAAACQFRRSLVHTTTTVWRGI